MKKNVHYAEGNLLYAQQGKEQMLGISSLGALIIQGADIQGTYNLQKLSCTGGETLLQ